MAVRGYYRHPTVKGDRIVFVSEDDLWSVSTRGGLAYRLTANPGAESYSRLSPDGELVAFSSRDEGRLEVHVMASGGGPARRLTFMGANTHPIGWASGGRSVVVASDWQQPFTGWLHLWEVPLEDGQPRPLGLGPARAISYQPGGLGLVIGRNSFDPARWKRYRGGRAGSIWIDRKGEGDFEELVFLAGNLADPMWVGRRVFYLSDHEGVGNVYSVTPTGRDIRRHTHHEDFYARFPSTDGRRIAYHCGGDIWILDPNRTSDKVEVELPSARPQRARRFLAAGRYLETAALHPLGHSVALVARGGTFTMPLWEGAPVRRGTASAHRRRLASFLPDGKRVIAVTDELGEECLVVESADGTGDARHLRPQLGRARTLDVAPAGSDRVAVTNHRHQLHLVDIGGGRSRLIHQNPYGWIEGTAWSPDGRWLAFSAATARNSYNIFLYDTSERRLTQVGRPNFADFAPAFDPEGRFLYFISGRSFDPVPDGHFHDYGFPKGYLPYLMCLKADQPSPFSAAQREPKPPGGSPPTPDKKETKEEEAKPVEIDLDGLADRVVAIPAAEGRYARIGGARGRVLFLSFPPAGTLEQKVMEPQRPKGRLESWDFATDKLESMMEGVGDFSVSADGKVVLVRAGKRLRVVAAAWKEDKNGKDLAGRETGWLDLDRVRLEVVPGEEWRQMFSEAWRLQRDLFWWEDMGGVDWLAIHRRYLPLVDRVASRGEFSDLLWEMQGELGTSHAYELGGDYRPEPKWTQGSLGADLQAQVRGFRVERIPLGDSWVPDAVSPLTAPGVDIRPGDRILEVEGVPVGRDRSPHELLVERGGREVTLTVSRGRGKGRRVVVKALSSENALRYRDWVETNRRWVEERSGGRAGYIHIPDMGAWGFSEFHRAWHSEVDKDGLVIDVRFNRGGNVSQLLLEKLARRRFGYSITRWRAPSPLPDDSPKGPMVCLTNENSGSDGDIFSHTFKLSGLGPLIGTRTWGGVVGIWPQQALVDGTVTTQPEFGFWFTDVGYGVENYGTDPDIEVVITPKDYRAGRDPPLERGVEELMAIIAESEPLVPEFGPPPSVRPPTLPA